MLHDAAFGAFMASQEVARDFVTLHFLEEYRQLCDLSTLRLEPSTFVDQDLKQYACDALFSMKSVSDGDGYVYCFVEHQSTENGKRKANAVCNTCSLQTKLELLLN